MIARLWKGWTTLETRMLTRDIYRGGSSRSSANLQCIIMNRTNRRQACEKRILLPILQKKYCSMYKVVHTLIE